MKICANGKSFFFAFAQKCGEKKKLIHSSKTMDKTMLFSRFENNFNKEALAIWESSFASLKDKFIALTYIDLPEFKDVAHGIVLAFNHRTGLSCTTLSDIEPSLVIKEDLAMMELRFSGLAKAVKIQEIVQGVQDSVMKASLVYSKQEILRMTINLLVGFENGSIPYEEDAQKAWADKNREKMLDLS
jgi:hypothetical protein